jgi:hypothetical protein
MMLSLISRMYPEDENASTITSYLSYKKERSPRAFSL